MHRQHFNQRDIDTQKNILQRQASMMAIAECKRMEIDDAVAIQVRIDEKTNRFFGGLTKRMETLFGNMDHHPHQGKKECARRVRQMAAGQI